MAYSPLASARATREVLARHGLHTKKALGQNFLIDDGVVGHILQLADLDPNEVVIEVGPGIGTLTCALLASCAGVVAVERDGDLLPVLSETCAGHGAKLKVLHADALKITRDDILRSCPALSPVDGSSAEMPRKLVANLPYAVAATVVLDTFERMLDVESVTVMVQREVAERMLAPVGTKDYGAYTVKLRLRARSSGRFGVSPTSFMPQPRVESTVIRLDRDERMWRGAPIAPSLLDAASRAADAAFFQRRKTIRNSISGYLKSRGYDGKQAAVLLTDAGIDPGVRGEALAVEEYLSLGESFLAAGI